MEPFVFFGGKGGVGKTTVSCAYAYRCANAGVRTLVVSTDPAHSVSDVFDQQFGDDPAPVEGVDGLDAMEIDPEDEMQRHLQEIREGFGRDRIRLDDAVSHVNSFHGPVEKGVGI